MNSEKPDHSEPNGPRWELLPFAPREFFDLSRDFDKKDLKRAYNRLIRRFKPEKFPLEFQKIREAYETLNADLRYQKSSQKTRDSDQGSFDWTQVESEPSQPRKPKLNKPKAPHHSEKDQQSESASEFPQKSDSESPIFETPEKEPPSVETPSFPSSPNPTPAKPTLPHSSPPKPTPALTLDQKLTQWPLQKTLDELIEKPTKTPRDYYQIAVLSETILVNSGQAKSGDRAGNGFEYWLFTGISKFPNDSGLKSLVREHFKHVPIEGLSQSLLKASKVFASGQFLYLTETAWDRLIRGRPFEEFSETLGVCESQMDLTGDFSVPTFYIHIMRPAIWCADEEWLQDKFEIIEDSYHQLPNSEQFEMNFIFDLRDYILNRDEFVQRGFVCASVDQAIRSWCVEDEMLGDQRVIECQYVIAKNGEELLDEIPPFSEESNQLDKLKELRILWEHIVTDVMARIGESESLVNNENSLLIRDYLVRISRRNRRRNLYGFQVICVMIGVAVFFTGVVAGISFLVRMVGLFSSGKYVAGLLDFVYCIVSIIAGLFVLVLPIIFNPAGILYKTNARPELLKLLRVVPSEPRELSEWIDKIYDGNGEDISDISNIAEEIENDMAIDLYALAQRCININ